MDPRATTLLMQARPPHLVWVIADDLGTFDVPFTGSGSEVLTPELSRLAAAGLVLDGYYVQPLCTPTRAAFLTGRHPVQLGLQHGVIRDAVPDAVPINDTLLPAVLRSSGYETHFVVHGPASRTLLLPCLNEETSRLLYVTLPHRSAHHRRANGILDSTSHATRP